MNPYLPYIYTWTLLAVAVLVLAVYRISLGSHDGVVVHLAPSDVAEPPAALEQRIRKINLLDRWGPALTILSVIYGLTLLGIYFYHVWFAGYQIPNQ
jgi:hypothetical protein